MREITDTTGGHTVTIEDREELPEAAAKISRELHCEYMLGYLPGDKLVNRWRKIRVEVVSSAVRRIRAHYKKGYMLAE